MGQPYKIFDDIYMVGGSDISHSMDCCVYLIDAGELVLIDSGAGKSTDRIIDNIKTLGFEPDKLSTVMVTHAHIDHIGALHDLKQKYGAKIIAHKGDAKAIVTGDKVGAEYYGVKYSPCIVDIILDGENTSLKVGQYDFEFIHIPGHTPGSIAIVLDIAGKSIIFGQDIHGPYNAEWGGDPEKAVKSLKIMQDINADMLCEGHYGIIKPAAKVREFIQDFISELG
jgi:glyoxylase-like metal-dependent hydrolase (beta-lactamase superfamily II)